mgnify:CR=1 FL=1
MIRITEYAGRDVAVYGLGRTGLSAALALKAGGARVHAWDDNEETRAKAEAAGIALSDINKRDWQTFAALVLSPGIPYRFPQPHRLVRMAEMTGVPVIGDMELFARAVQALPERVFGGGLRERSQESARGLGVAKEELRFFVDVVGVGDEVGQVTVVGVRAAGGDAGADVFPRGGQDRRLGSEDVRADLAGHDHVAQVAEQAKAGHVREGVRFDFGQHFRGDAIERTHHFDGLLNRTKTVLVVLGRRGDDARAQRLGEQQHVARSRAVVGQHAAR